MAVKLSCSLRTAGPPEWVRSGAIDPWRETFSWQRFHNDFHPLLKEAA
jgi:hypothetical protein